MVNNGFFVYPYVEGDWFSQTTFEQAVKNYWDVHSTNPNCVSSDAKCRFVFTVGTLDADKYVSLAVYLE
jgi:hypothetical protein